MRTAIRTFAARDHFGTTTSEVPKDAGISQGYLYRLFPDKEALFTAVIDYCTARTREGFAEAVATVNSTDPQEILASVKRSFRGFVADRDLLMILMHGNCAAREPAIGEAVRVCYAKQVENLQAVSGASDEQVRRYFADEFLAGVMRAVGAEGVDALWARTLRGPNL